VSPAPLGLLDGLRVGPELTVEMTTVPGGFAVLDGIGTSSHDAALIIARPGAPLTRAKLPTPVAGSYIAYWEGVVYVFGLPCRGYDGGIFETDSWASECAGTNYVELAYDIEDASWQTISRHVARDVNGFYPWAVSHGYVLADVPDAHGGITRKTVRLRLRDGRVETIDDLDDSTKEVVCASPTGFTRASITADLTPREGPPLAMPIMVSVETLANGQGRWRPAPSTETTLSGRFPSVVGCTPSGMVLAVTSQGDEPSKVVSFVVRRGGQTVWSAGPLAGAPVIGSFVAGATNGAAPALWHGLGHAAQAEVYVLDGQRWRPVGKVMYGRPRVYAVSGAHLAYVERRVPDQVLHVLSAA
jgi:hypothetical protein